ncbi:MAG: hypothetical protein Q8L24_00110 [bacterium]|nr:hypothetical protein [bacterium]
MKTFVALLFIFHFSFFTATGAFAYPGEVKKPDDKVPAVEKWTASDVTPPKYHYSDLRLSRTGTALKLGDVRKPIADSVFYEDPAHPGEFGAVYRSLNEKEEWVIFAKSWGMKKVNGQWEQDVDADGDGNPDGNGKVNFAVLDCYGRWCSGIEGETNFYWKPYWHNPETKDYVVEVSYAIAGKDANDPSGLFLHAGHVSLLPENPVENYAEDSKRDPSLQEVKYLYYSHRVGMVLFKIGDKSIAVAKSGIKVEVSTGTTLSLFVRLGKAEATDGSTYESATVFVRSKLEADALEESMKVNQPITLEAEESDEDNSDSPEDEK